MGSSFRASHDWRSLSSLERWKPPSTQELIWGLLLFSHFFGDLCNSPFNRGVGLHWLGTLGGSFLWLCGRRFLWESHATEDGLIREGDVTFHFLPELHYAPCQKVWLGLSRQIGFLHPKLEGFGIDHCLLQLQFLISRQANSESCCGRKLFQWMNGVAGGA